MKKERIIELIDEHLEEPNSMSKEWAKALRKIRGKLIKKQSAFPWEDFKNKNIAVHCGTEEKAKAFLAECKTHGFKWITGSGCTDYTRWEEHKNNTCYSGGVGFSNVEFYKRKGYEIVEYPFVEKNQSADKPLTINKMVKEAHETAEEKGWWDEERSFGEQIALIHSELSEALEEARKGNETDAIIFECDAGENLCIRRGIIGCNECNHSKPCGIPTELADTVIRIADLCGHYNIDLDNALKIKMQYNKGREYKHGKVF